jgi:uncharacterized repeat protein (TIGR02543 family)
MEKRLFTILILIIILLTVIMVSCESDSDFYQITLKDGELEITQEQVIENEEFIFPSGKEPIKQDYIFSGWSLDDGITTYDSEEKITITHDVIFYAQWKFLPAAPTGISKTDETRVGLNDGALVNVNSTQEYQINGSGEWIAITGSSITDLSPGSYIIRIKETESNSSGIETTPFIILEASEKQDGLIAPTGISKTDQTGVGLNDGTLVGLTSTQEYQINGTGEWIAITESPVTGLGPGSYTVREKATDTHKSGTVTMAFVIDEVAVSDIVLTPDELVLVSNGEIKTINSTITPNNASDQTISWVSNNSDIITVDSGEVTSLAAGSTFITATAGDKVVTIQVTVKEATSSSSFIFDNATGTITGCTDYINRNIVIPTKINGVNVQAIGEKTFYCFGLKSIYIPNSIASIGFGAFRNNSLETVTIPSSVTTLGPDSFLNKGSNQGSESIPTGEDFTGTWILVGFSWYKSN